MIETIISWCITVCSLTGAIFNARGNIWGFYIWIPANIAWVVYDFIVGQPAQATLFIAYTVISLVGVYTWRKNKIGEKK